VDIDEVLARFADALCAWHNDEEGTALTADDITDYHFCRVDGFGSEAETHAKMLRFFRSPHFHAMEPISGAAAVLRRHAPAYTFIVLTSRSDTLEEATLAWLRKYFGGLGTADSLFHSVVFTNAYGGRAKTRTKGQMCMELGAFALLDDNRAYVAEAAASVQHVVLHGRYAWNGHGDLTGLPQNCRATADWAAIDALLEQWTLEADSVLTR
jgi:hypothetical protein